MRTTLIKPGAAVESINNPVIAIGMKRAVAANSEMSMKLRENKEKVGSTCRDQLYK